MVKTSAIGLSEEGADIGAKAAFTAANKAGGVNGRTIDYLGSIDNHYDPADDLPTAQKIVQDKAFAAVPMVNGVLAQGGNYLVTNKVPFIGWGVTPAFCNNTVGFGFSGCLVPTTKADKVATTAAGLIDKTLGVADGAGKTVAIISDDSTGGQFGITVSNAAFQTDKWTVVYSKANVPVSTTVTDYTPYSEQLLHSNHGSAPTVIYLINTPPAVIGIGAALRAEGYTGIIYNAVTYGASYLASAQSAAALNGQYVWVQYQNLQAKTPANKEMLTDVEAVDPSQTSLTQDIAIGYYSAKIFLDILKKTGPDVTRSAFLATANNNYSFSVPGGLTGIKFPADHDEAGPCGSLVQIKGAQFISKSNLECFADTPLSSAQAVG